MVIALGKTTPFLTKTFRMAQHILPYQCLQKSGKTLVAASGSRLDLFSLEDGSLLSTWNCPTTQNSQNGKQTTKEDVAPAVVPQKSESSSVDITTEEPSSPPTKRRKLSASEPDVAMSDPPKPEAKQSKKKNTRAIAVSGGLETPAIIALASTKCGRHVVAVTGEDKSIRVFENTVEDGLRRLKQLSHRQMPKRPCAITITTDDLTIISADKFGDVYSLPLIPSEEPLEVSTPNPEPTTAKTYTPAANELTIHSLRNRKALEQQRRQKASNKAPEKTEPSFIHTLLLGHVSMLTDLTLINYKERNYIITADRDEHIRISRGIPQAHIIEGFCLGHTEFVSRLCVPTDRPEILISGGGDDELFVWNWLDGKLLSRINLKSLVLAIQPISTGGEEGIEAGKLAVSSIHHTRQGSQDIILVTCEGIPVLFLFTLTPQSTLTHTQTLSLPGNPLALTPNLPSPISNQILISIDTIHKPGSTTEPREDFTEALAPLKSFKFEEGKLVEMEGLIKGYGESQGGELEEVMVQMKSLLYNLENLRKREVDGMDE